MQGEMVGRVSEGMARYDLAGEEHCKVPRALVVDPVVLLGAGSRSVKPGLEFPQLVIRGAKTLGNS